MNPIIALSSLAISRIKWCTSTIRISPTTAGRMGIEILSFTIKDVYDNVDYLASLGKTQTAAVKRDAEIGVAQVY